MIKFIDANIFIERWSNPKALEFTNALDREQHCTSVLVLTEVYHKLTKKNVKGAFEYIRNIMGTIKVFEITPDDLFNAMKSSVIMDANDKIHLTVMKRNDVKIIISYDTDFDRDKTIVREEL